MDHPLAPLAPDEPDDAARKAVNMITGASRGQKSARIESLVRG